MSYAFGLTDYEMYPEDGFFFEFVALDEDESQHLVAVVLEIEQNILLAEYLWPDRII